MSEPEKILGSKGPKARFERNKKALETYQIVSDEGREPTPDEMDAIAAYIGWGSFGQELFQGSWDRAMPKAGWEKESQWLRDHLGKEGWRSIQDSIINSHYTDPPTVKAMWDIVRNLGFDGGRVLEPSMGIGNFFAMMPREMMAHSQLTGIELEQVVGEMAKMLHPQANIQIKGYEQSQTADNFYDLVIGNWPFAKDGPSDPRYNRFNLSLHDYFFVKALDQVRPGGIVIGITSSGTMDKKGAGARQQMARRAELLGAYRLPSGAFEQYAGTGVVTDILIFRKRMEPTNDLRDQGWLNTTNLKTRNGPEITVNEYWSSHPDHVLGELNYGHGTTAGRAGMIVDRPSDYQEQLAKLPSITPKNAFQPWDRKEGEIEFIANDDKKARQNTVVYDEKKNDLYVVTGDHLVSLNGPAKWKVKSAAVNSQRLAEGRGLIDIARALDTLLATQTNPTLDAEAARKDLRQAYDSFVEAYGWIADSVMLSVFQKAKDPRIKHVENLERRTDSGIETAAIMDRDITRRPDLNVKGSIEDAYAASFNQSINLDVDKIAELSGRPRQEVIDRLKELGQIFQRPDGVWESRESYLSGNVRRKLREAVAAKEQGMEMDDNIKELTAVQPKDVPYFNIEVQMGANWIEPGDYLDYAAHLVETKPEESADNFSLVKTPSGWQFKVISDRVKRSPQSTMKWGVGDMKFNRLFDAAMNGVGVTITVKDEDGRTHVDTKATEQANEKIEKIREGFADWLWSDTSRAGRLAVNYNELRNSEVTPKRSGSHLRFPGLALTLGYSEFDFRQHQRDAVWRGLSDGRMVGFHEVGTGKTFTMAGLAMEGRRLGLMRKPILFAHNANSQDVANDMNVAYPGAKVLYVDNLSPANRDNALRQIALDDWDLIVVPHSLISRFSFSQETLMEMAQEQIAELEDEIYSAAEDADADLTGVDLNDKEAVSKVLARKKGAHTAKELVKARKRIIKRIMDKAADATKGDAVSFEELGIDAIMVDEAHLFKKQQLATRKQVKGLNKEGNDMTWSLNAMTDYVKRQNNGRGVYLFTGTPLTNNLNEAYNMMRLVMGDVMDDAGVLRFDDWFNSFAQTTNEIELTSGGTFEPVTRLLSFINVPELARLAGRYFDVVLAKNMPEFKDRESHEGRDPEAKGRPYKQIRTIIAQMSPEQKAHKRDLERRYQEYQKLDGKAKKERSLRGGDTPLKMETEGPNAALDYRLHDPTAPDFAGSKVNQVIEAAMDIFHEDEDSTQMIFMERGFNDFVDAEVVVRDEEGTPQKNPDTGKNIIRKERRRKFNLVRDMVEKMIAKGARPDQIAVFSNMALDPASSRPGDVLRQVHRVTGKVTRKDLAEKMRTGEIRFAIGSTQTMGTGVNAQRLLRAMWHLDAPWTPGELEQRNGRGWRQGNEWNTVIDGRAMTEGSYDGRRWQVLLNKSNFIRRFTEMLQDVNSGSGARVLTGDGAELSDGEGAGDIEQSFSAAVGDPRILLRAKLKKDVEKLERRRDTHARGIAEAQRQIGRLTRERASYSELVAESEKDAATYSTEQAKGFSLKLGDKTYTERKAAEEAVASLPTRTKAGKVGEFMGLDLVFNPNPNRDYETNFSLKGVLAYPMGNFSVSAMEAVGRRINNAIKSYQDRVDTADKGIASLEVSTREPFGRSKELEAAKEALATIEAELNRAPQPAPAWLRYGAPQGSLVQVDGNLFDVAAHRWDTNGYWVLVDDNGTIRPVNYLEVRDENGQQIFEEQEFIPPSGEVAAAETEATPTDAPPRRGGRDLGRSDRLLEVDRPENPRESKASRIRRILDQVDARMQERFRGAATAQEVEASERAAWGRLDASRRRLLRELGSIEQEKMGEALRGEIRGLASPEPTAPEGGLISAYRELPAVVRDVVSRKADGKSNADIARELKMTPQAVESAYREGVGMLYRAREALNRLPETFARAQQEEAGSRTIGRPDRANVPSGEQSRRFVDATDQTQVDAGVPRTRRDAEVFEEAEQRLKRYAAEKKKLLDIAKSGGRLSDTDTVVAKKIVSREVLSAIRSKDPKKMMDAALIVDAYRVTGTEAARAFRLRRDWTKSPAERAMEYLAKNVLTPPKRVTAEMDKTTDLEKRERILKEWLKQVEKIKARLKQLGLDLDNMSERDVADWLSKDDNARKAGMAAASAKKDTWDALHEYWLSSILSAPTTQMANIVGNTANAFWDFTVQRFTEAMINKVIGNKDGAQIGEFRYILKGILPGISNAAKNFMASYRDETTVFEESILGEDGASKLDYERGHAITGTKGKIIRTPLRLLQATDEFAKTLIGYLQVGAEAYRIANREGLKGDTMSQRIADLMRIDKADPSEAWVNAAAKSVELTFQEDLGTAGQLVMNARHKFRPLAYVVPFVKTPVNIFKMGVRKSPLGTLPMLYRIARQGLVSSGIDQRSGFEYSARQFSVDAAEQILAWGTVMALAALVQPDDEGLPWITGSPDKSRGGRDLAYRTAPPLSIRLGDTWVSYARIEPAAVSVASTVDFLNAVSDTMKGGDATAAFGKMVDSVVAQLQDKTFLRGISDIINAVQDGSKAVGWAGNFATSWVPNIIRSGARSTDDALREQRVWGTGDEWTQSLLQSLAYKAAPVASDLLQPKVDLWGKEIEKAQYHPATDWLARMTSVTRTHQSDPNRLDRMLMNWNNQNPNERMAPTAPAPMWKMKVNGKNETIYMTREEYRDFLVRAGSLSETRLMALPLNIDAPTAKDIEALYKEVAKARREVRRAMLQERTAIQ